MSTEIYRPKRMKFGAFLAPFHRANENPTIAIERDLEYIEQMDRFNFDEVWIGEHHSAGWEIIASPELVMVAAAQRTRSIKVGTGVLSLPYHNPLIVADRFVQLDHMTRGRAMLGVGPGALTSDAYMMGIDPLEQRRMMDESLGAILALLRGEIVNMETDWFTLKDARLQLASYTYPHLPVAVAAAFSPAGPITAGKHGVGILSNALNHPDGQQSLERTWDWASEAAAESGKTISREDWRVVLPFHLAESKKEAIQDIREMFRHEAEDYFGATIGRGPAPGEGSLEAAIERGSIIVGTPDDAIPIIEHVLEISGGFGGMLTRPGEYTTWDKTVHSLELWSRYVMPRFQGQIAPKEASVDWVSSNPAAKVNTDAVTKAFEDAGKNVPGNVDESQRPR
ncbi:MAG: LLM class flavin-dependent oxidoreductase [Tepidiformaceae bacterium]